MSSPKQPVIHVRSSERGMLGPLIFRPFTGPYKNRYELVYRLIVLWILLAWTRSFVLAFLKGAG